MTSPWVRGSLVRHRGGRGAGAGGASGPIAPNIALLTPHTDGTLSLTDRGTDGVTVSVTRATTGWVPDWENVYRLAASGEARIAGARRVSNLLTYSNDFSNAAWVAAAITKVGTAEGGYRLDFDANANANINQNKVVSGSAYVGSIEIKADSPCTLRLGSGSDGSLASISVTTSWQRFSDSNGSSNPGIRLFNSLDAAARTVYVRQAQAEVKDGATDSTLPGEYVATTTAAATKYFYTTNGNSVASNVVTEGVGDELRPTRTVTAGNYQYKRFDSYATWTASESGITVGDRRLPKTRSGNAAAVTYAGASPTGFYYECTAITTGTCDSTEPAWPETLTNTVVDGGVTWTCQGLYTVSGAVIEQAVTQSILQSRNFGVTWTTSGTPTSAQDQTGFDGSANTAWTLADDDGAATEHFQQVVSVSNDSNTHLAAILIKKDSNESRFPRFDFALTAGATQVRASYQLNTKTGATADTGLSAETNSVGVVDLGDWWWMYLTCTNNTTGNTSATVYVMPADGTVLGTRSTAATGTCVVDHAQLYLNTSTLPATPGLATTATAATRNADAISFPEPAWFDTAGTVLVDYDSVTYPGNARLIYGGAGGPLYIRNSASSQNASYDGTGIVQSGAGSADPGRGACRWGGSARQHSLNGTNGTEGSYDGDYNATTQHLGSNVGTGNFLNGTLLNVILLQTDIGATDLATATARDAT